METAPDNESAIQIIAQAKAAGFVVSDDQLHRWYRAGLLPKATQYWTEGREGSGVFFPPGTGNQLCALGRVRRGKDIERWGWDLWWLGFPVDLPLWRGHLERRALQYDETVPRLLTLLIGNTSKSVAEEFHVMRTNNFLFRQLRKRLGRSKLADFLALVAQILQGDFQKWSVFPTDDPDNLIDRAIVDKAFGLNRAKNEEQLKNAPAMHEDIENVLDLLSARLGGAKLSEVLSAQSDQQIVDARNQLRAILFAAESIGSNPMQGFGLKVFARFAKLTASLTQTTFLLYLLALKEDETFALNLSTFLDAVRNDIPDNYRQEQIIAYIRSQDPAIASFAFPT